MATSGGFRGGAPGAPPYSPKFSQFHAVFLRNLAKSYVGAPLEGWRPLLRGILDPPLATLYYAEVFTLHRAGLRF